MKKTILILFVLNFNIMFSQNYFEGKNLYCKSENLEALQLFNDGVKFLYLNTSLNKKYLTITANVFFEAYKKDTTFCDALFFTGYTLRLLDDKDALKFYMLADKSYDKSIEFKTNLAAECLKYGNEKAIEVARKKYEEIVKLYPDSPEGYYGIAVTSPILGDYDNGLENINLAIDKYKLINLKLKSDVFYIKGILLSLNKNYDEALVHLDNAYSSYKKDFNFKIHYSLSLLKVSETKKDDKMKKKAFNFYEKIKEKDVIPQEVKDQFTPK
ncbi:tetratricopeptide repeat protein [Flavobacterium hercynium]|nr:hypothetical protein [Flavobacterium hercynium]SMP27379.1 hypothetical protein SAMN06265346_11090 [Flavobacterium hercynium]